MVVINAIPTNIMTVLLEAAKIAIPTVMTV